MTFPDLNRVAKCRHGTLIFNRQDVYIGRSLELYGEFSQGETDFFEQVVRPGAFVVEAGANIGAHTLRLAQLAGSAGKVYAFEPQRIVFQTLCGNMALNNITNALCYNAAVGETSGTIEVPQLDFAQDGNFGGLSLLRQPRGELREEVPLVTVDGLSLSRCDFLKVDVEGMEEAVLRGAQQTIAEFEPLIYMECDREDRSHSLQSFVDSLGYAMYWHMPPYFNPNNFRGNQENVFGNLVSANIICVKPGGRFKIEGQERI